MKKTNIEKDLSNKVKEINGRNKIRGITLISLVITIVVLLILASVTLGFAMNGTGLFEKAKLATDQYNNKAQQEEYELEKTTNKINGYINGNRDVTLSDEIKNYIDNKMNKSALNISASGKYNTNGNSVKIPLDTLGDSSGDKLTLDNGGIKIGSGVSKVLVSASCEIQNGAAGRNFYISICKNDIVYSCANNRMYGDTTGVNSSALFINVTEGDYIYMYVGNTSGGGTACSCRMTIVEL